MKEERIISDDPRSGHPISVLTDENIERLRQIIEEDPHSTSQVESVSSDPIGNFTFSPQSDYQTLPEIGDRNSQNWIQTDRLRFVFCHRYPRISDSFQKDPR